MVSRRYSKSSKSTYVVLEEPDALGEQPSTNEEEQVGRGNQEPAKGNGRTTSIDDVTNDGTGKDTSDDGDGNRCSGLTERDLCVGWSVVVRSQRRSY